MKRRRALVEAALKSATGGRTERTSRIEKDLAAMPESE
jgi:hypothetical protein